MAQAEDFILEAHGYGLRVILDIVPNHISSAHVWFKAALEGDPAMRGRYIFRSGKGDTGELPPNDWQSHCGGSAWTRVTDASGQPGDWYLHLFAASQPDLDWSDAGVRAEFEDILRFWFDRGVDGFRIDVAHGLSKAPGLPDAGKIPASPSHVHAHPAWDQDEVHEMLTLALPGSAYIYQGEELGLAEVEDVPDDLRQDPAWWQSGHTDPGRDGCRVPLPWAGSSPPFGFSPDGAPVSPWLAQPKEWATLTAQAQDSAADSMLTLYRQALTLRRQHLEALSPVAWVPSPQGALAFRRGGVECWVNTGAADVPLPQGRVLLASDLQTNGHVITVDTAAWVGVS